MKTIYCFNLSVVFVKYISVRKNKFCHKLTPVAYCDAFSVLLYKINDNVENMLLHLEKSIF